MEGHPMSPEDPLAPKRPRMKLLVVGVGLALLLGAGFWVLESGTQPVDPKASPSAAKPPAAATEAGSVPEVQVVKPARRDVAATLRLPATVSPLQQTTIYAKVAGYLKAVNYDKGDRVKQGQVLAVIDAPEIEQQYEEALADYTIRKVTSERLAQVWKQAPDVIAKQDVDVAEASAKAAQHLLEQRQTWLDYTKVRAPYAGVGKPGGHHTGVRRAHLRVIQPRLSLLQEMLCGLRRRLSHINILLGDDIRGLLPDLRQPLVRHLLNGVVRQSLLILLLDFRRVDHCQDLSLLHPVSFVVIDSLQIAGYLGINRRLLKRRNGSRQAERGSHVAACRFDNLHFRNAPSLRGRRRRLGGGWRRSLIDGLCARFQHPETSPEQERNTDTHHQ